MAGVGGLAGLTVARRRDELAVSQADRERLSATATREQFDDWITRARVPASARADPLVPVDSLDGLVDVAIDTDARVVEDRGRDEFVVLGDAVTYVYRPTDPRTGDFGTTDPDPLTYSDESRSPGDVTSAEATTDGRENGATAPSANLTEAPSSETESIHDEPENDASEKPAPDEGVLAESVAGENGDASPTELIPAEHATGATADPSPDTDAPDRSADDPTAEQSADDGSSDQTPVDGTADDAVETVPVPSLAVDGHPAVYHEDDGAGIDGWLDDWNLARRSPSDD